MYYLRRLASQGKISRTKAWKHVTLRGRTMGVCGPEILACPWAKPFDFPGIIPLPQFVAMVRRGEAPTRREMPMLQRCAR